MKKYDINMFRWMHDLFPLPRSLMGKGTLQTLEYLKKINKKLNIISFNSGTKVLDWIIPLEWEVRDSYIQHNKSKKMFAKFSDNNLHILSYSNPKKTIMDLQFLKKNIFSDPKRPKDIPYVTSYYTNNWGVCMSDKEKKNLPRGKYKVCIDTTLKKGKLNLGELLIKGKNSKEIFFSTYVCHPSMANNELSGPVLSSALAKYIQSKYKKPKYSYRFVFLPETIGSIAYLSKKIKILKKNVICGFVLSCVGDERNYSLIHSRKNNTLADKALKAALIGKNNVKIYSYLDRGSDERQYCAPKVDLPVCGFCKSKYGTYPEYHTSADNLNFVTEKGLSQSFDVMKDIIDSFEIGINPMNTIIGEPQLGKRDLYPNMNIKDGKVNYLTSKEEIFIRMNTISNADGKNTIFDIASIINIPLKKIINEVGILKRNKILI